MILQYCKTMIFFHPCLPSKTQGSENLTLEDLLYFWVKKWRYRSKILRSCHLKVTENLTSEVKMTTSMLSLSFEVRFLVPSCEKDVCDQLGLKFWNSAHFFPAPCSLTSGIPRSQSHALSWPFYKALLIRWRMDNFPQYCGYAWQNDQKILTWRSHWN